MIHDTHLLRFEQMRERLGREFPAFAVPEKGERSPLACGIHVDLAERTGMSTRQAKRFLHVWCRRPRYLEAIVTSTWRVNLEGRPVGIVWPEQRDMAINMLQRGGRGAMAALKRLEKEQFA